MTDPQDNQTNRARYRSSAISGSSLYTFSHVFPPETTQSDFFTKTTLPLVRDVLQGQNGLLFTYGVTNSGKTYTVQGGNTQGSAGILPRTLDVIFNSIEGLQGDGKVSSHAFSNCWDRLNRERSIVPYVCTVLNRQMQMTQTFPKCLPNLP